MPKDVTGPLATPEVLSLPTMAWTPASQSPWRFGGAIGLGIVAAMSDGGSRRHKPAPPAAGLTRSQPIPIAAPLLPVPAVRGGKPQPRCAERMARVDWEEEEFSEGHTWVISHVGGYTVRRMVYFDDGYGGGGVFHESPQRWVAILPPPSDFLSCCFLCRKKLLGLDIFMYRGEKGFCSAECRYQQMLRDEQRETKKEGSKAVELLKLPASPPFFSNSVAAA